MGSEEPLRLVVRPQLWRSRRMIACINRQRRALYGPSQVANAAPHSGARVVPLRDSLIALTDNARCLMYDSASSAGVEYEYV